TVPVLGIDVRAVLDQVVSRLDVLCGGAGLAGRRGIDYRGEQRGRAVRIALLDIRSGGDQQFGDLEVSLSCRIQQRRLGAADRRARAARRKAAPVHAYALGRGNLAWQTPCRLVTGQGLQIPVGPGVEQQRCGFRGARAHTAHQRGLLVVRLTRIDVDTAL